MSSNAPWWIVLFVWMGLATYWHTCQIKGLCYEPTPTPAEAVETPAVETLAVEPLNIDSIPDSEEALANAQKYEGVFKPMDLYFPKGSANYIKTGANRQFIEEVQKYLVANPGNKLLLTGHTDNDGNDAMNMTLSRQRAEGVKKQLTRTGIAADQLVTDGKGETQPKETNDTPEGRRANRRVNIVVQ